jgi:hypothetical protein
MTGRSFPGGAAFAFSVFDDTDNGTVANAAPVYRLFAELGIRTTKSVWVYPPRGRFKGECLLDPHYRAWILDLKAQGFEIALHNVGDGAFTREEILEGLELFRAILGDYPRSHANHTANPDNIYWWQERFERPFNHLYALASRLHRGRRPHHGHDPASAHFWGDACKQHIRYIRNLTFNGIDTISYDPRMPYRVRRKAYANCWFSSSDGQTISEFTDLLAPSNVDALEARGGACIVYTHLAGFADQDGRVDPTFEQRVRYLASKKGWFVPVSTLLDHLAGQHRGTDDPGYAYRLRLNLRWGADRIRKKLRYGR